MAWGRANDGALMHVWALEWGDYRTIERDVQADANLINGLCVHARCV